jgi:hypothetical protein
MPLYAFKEILRNRKQESKIGQFGREEKRCKTNLSSSERDSLDSLRVPIGFCEAIGLFQFPIGRLATASLRETVLDESGSH